MARVRNNQGHRNKILNVFMRPYLEQEHTQEKEAFDQARNCKTFARSNMETC